MSRIHSSKSLVLCAVALVLLTSAAHAQLVVSSPSALGYVKSSGVVTPGTGTTTATVTAAADSTVYTVVQGASWLNAVCMSGSPCTAGTGDTDPGGPIDTLTFSVVPSAANLLTATTVGTSYNTSVALQVSGTTVATVSVTLTLTSSKSPLSTTTPTISLTYISGGVANQTSATATATITDSDTVADSYTISGAPGWLSVSATHGTASVSTGDTLTFTVVQSAANGLSASPSNATVNLVVAGNLNYAITVSLALIVQQPLLTSSAVAPFGYTIGTGTMPANGTAAITVASGSIAFSVDPSTVPAWLTATSGGTASTTPTTVTFAPVSAVIKALAAGNYSASIGYEAANAEHELLIPVTLTVSNPTATVSIKGLQTNTAILNYPGASLPAPVVTVLSSDEPVGFSATCSVTSTYPAYVQSQAPCQLTGASAEAATVTGIAYTYGSPLTVAFDPALFLAPGTASGTPFGTVVTVTVTVTAGSQSAVHQSYAYTIQPIAPTFTSLSPTSAAQIALNDSLLVTLTGNNFVGPNQILGGNAISPTKVFVGGNDVTADSVVISGTTMIVSVPQLNFPPYATGKTTANMVIGVANQVTISPSVPTATETLVVTTAPVVYAVTSTATYVQPSPGFLPKVAPFELISIFGANFGGTGNVTGILSAYNQFPTALPISGSGSSAVNVTVTFKIGTTTYKAPILFANGTQINCAVPAGITVGQNASVTVTSGTNTSDGGFLVSVVASQPGLFTLGSDGVGQGAILNSDYSVNGSAHPASAGSSIILYLTGLGVPNSTAVDNAANTGGAYPTNCVAISDVTSGSPGYMQVLNTTNSHATPPYTAPSTPFANIDGIAIEPQFLLGTGTSLGTGALPPCIVNSGSTAVTVTLGTTTVPSVDMGYAGFVSGAVAGLYQINVTIPSSFASTGNIPVMVAIGSQSSPAGVVTVNVQ